MAEAKKPVRSPENIKINISLKRVLLEKMDTFADSLGLTRSAFIALCCSQYMNAQEGVERMKELVGIMSELKEKENLSDADLKRVDYMENFVNMLDEGINT